MDSLRVNFFYFSRNERIGILFISLISLLALLVPVVYEKFGSSISRPDRTDDETSLNAALSKLEVKQRSEEENVRNFERRFVTPDFKFEINTASFKQLLSLGISPKIARTIIKYRDKGGQFKTQESLKKIYGISEKDLDILRQQTFISVEPIKDNLLNPVNFDPNTVTSEDLQKIGLPVKIVQTIMNFRDKGGRFYEREDLSKIYGMKSEWISQLLPYTFIREKEKPSVPTDAVKQTSNRIISKKIQLININKTTVDELDKLRGVGPAIAARIIKFRDALGGFVSKDQFSEIRNLPDSVILSLQNSVVINGDYNKIKINTAQRQDLSKHPYINSSQATILNNYRMQHGSFKNIEDVSRSKAFSDKELKKIEGYLDFSD